jgi:signal transduction histidine kinase
MPKHLRVKFANGVFVPLDHPVAIEEGTTISVIVPDRVPAETEVAGGKRESAAAFRVMHELLRPLIAARSALWMAQTELGSQQSFKYPYLEDAIAWLDLLTALVEQVRPGNDRPRKERVLLGRDVIAPSVRQMRSLLNERGLSPHNIISRGLDDLPPLYVDRAMMSQLFFNLITNAINYSFDDSAAFSVEITAVVSGAGTTISIRDWGIGVPSGMEKVIFEEGVRAGGSANVTGAGLGLWVARRIAELHGGQLLLTHTSMPTEFSLVLPESTTVLPILGDTE